MPFRRKPRSDKRAPKLQQFAFDSGAKLPEKPQPVARKRPAKKPM